MGLCIGFVEHPHGRFVSVAGVASSDGRFVLVAGVASSHGRFISVAGVASRVDGHVRCLLVEDSPSAGRRFRKRFLMFSR
jgi:hypothetical protein